MALPFEAQKLKLCRSFRVLRQDTESVRQKWLITYSNEIVFIPNPSIGKPAIEFRFKHALVKLMLHHFPLQWNEYLFGRMLLVVWPVLVSSSPFSSHFVVYQADLWLSVPVLGFPASVLDSSLSRSRRLSHHSVVGSWQ